MLAGAISSACCSSPIVWALMLRFSLRRFIQESQKKLFKNSLKFFGPEELNGSLHTDYHSRWFGKQEATLKQECGLLRMVSLACSAHKSARNGSAHWHWMCPHRIMASLFGNRLSIRIGGVRILTLYAPSFGWLTSRFSHWKSLFADEPSRKWSYSIGASRQTSVYFTVQTGAS